jgi:hypothetical protein
VPATLSAVDETSDSDPWPPAPGDVGLLENGVMSREDHINVFETSLPVRLDYEAAMVYVLLPPVAGVLVLIFERKSDYVRYHAWQSSLLFSAIFVSLFRAR